MRDAAPLSHTIHKLLLCRVGLLIPRERCWIPSHLQRVENVQLGSSLKKEQDKEEAEGRREVRRELEFPEKLMKSSNILVHSALLHVVGMRALLFSFLSPARLNIHPFII